MTTKSIEQDPERVDRLNDVIEDIYERLTPNEVDILASAFQKSILTMIEVREVHETFVHFGAVYEEREFAPTIVSPLLLEELRAGDIFLAHLGFRHRKWEIIWMGPAYETVEWTLDDSDSHPGGGWPC